MSNTSSSRRLQGVMTLAGLWVLLLCCSGSAMGDTPAQVLDPVAYRMHHHSLALELDEDVDASRDERSAAEVEKSELPPPIIKHETMGYAKGRILKTLFGRDFSAFHNMPYASQPTRFQYSSVFNDTLEGWGSSDDPLDGTYFKSRCAQHSLIAPIVSGSEYCLHASVYSPITNFTKEVKPDLPVMVFIHGGAYMTGEATFYMPSKLLDKDVVVVAIQYRLGTLGFLYSGTVEAPGNMGLMDQVTALRWVNQFIYLFGGNKDLVTVFGQSAGGASTSWMQITPLTGPEANNGETLAHRFIPMSGSALEYWTLDHNPEEGFLLQVAEIGCPTDVNTTKSEMVECMASKELDEIVMASLRVYSKDRYAGGLGFVGQVPVVQAPELAKYLELVIPEHPLESLRNGRFLQAPTMTGAVRDEGSLVVGLLYDGYMKPHNVTNDTNFLKNDLFPMITNAFGIEDTTHAISNSFQLAFEPHGLKLGNWDEMVGGLVDLGGMLFLKTGMWTLAHEINAYNPSVPVYFYSFEFESSNSLFPWIFMSDPEIPVVGGVCHADDLMYLFNLPASFGDREKEMVKKMTTLYTNFAIYGNPTPPEVKDEAGQWNTFSPEWKPFDLKDLSFMLLQDNITLLQDFTTRWNYNMNGYGNKTVAAKRIESQPEDENQVPATLYEEAVAKYEQAEDKYQRLVAEADQNEQEAAEVGRFKTYTAIMGALVGCLAVAFLVSVVLLKKKARANGLLGVDNLNMQVSI